MYLTPRDIAGTKNRMLFDGGGKLHLKQLGANLQWLGPQKLDTDENRLLAQRTLVAGVRTHIAAVSTGKELRLYVDGRPAGVKRLTSSPSGSPVACTFGGLPSGGPNWEPFDGLIDQVRISTTARFAAKFTPEPKLSADSDTHALYLFSDSRGDVLIDSSGHANQGQIIAAKWVADITTAARPKSQTRQPADAIRFGTKFYKVFDAKITWEEAKARCESMGGRLPVVRSQEENDFLLNLAVQSNLAGVWLGGNDQKQEGHWEWTDGTPLEFTNWDRNTNQPNNAQDLEHYVVLLVSQKGKWWDYPNDPPQHPSITRQGIPGFVCEW